jgi:hypothetical protein
MKPHHFPFPAIIARWLLVALAALVLVSRAPAQSAPEERWLLVFDTSWAMKKRLPAVETAVKSFFATNATGQLRPGASVGVWTFGQQLRTGQFPLVVWTPGSAAGATSNLVAFIRKQHYSGTTSFAALQPLLGRIITGSERLTVVIFCDGLDEITWTPYNDAINAAFRQGRNERSKARQPFVLVLRTQRGQFTGSAVNLPPAGLNLPPFPPLPEPVKPVPPVAPPPVHVVAKPPPPVVPPLIIIGTKASTNLDDILKPATNLPVKSFVPAPLPAPVPATNSPVTNPVVSVMTVSNPPEPPLKKTNRMERVETNLPGPSTNRVNAAVVTNPDDGGTRRWLVAGAGLFVIALALGVVLVVRVRNRGRGSLISSSMNQDRRPPERR